VHCAFLTGEAAAPDQAVARHIHVVPGLSYTTENDAVDLRTAAREALGVTPDLWHIHNHSLGKNSALPRAVAELAEAGEKILLQIHDFAEDGRPANYRVLAPVLNRLYPVAPNIHYAVLNRRDFSILAKAGIPEKNLHLLPNAVSPLPEVRSSIVHRQSPMLYVYPCRAIRRKNIGELLLWSAVMPEARFAVTLAPKNPEVKPVYDAWVQFAEAHSLPVEFDAGADTPFPELIASAGALITTSIAEGFGLAFLEPWLAGKPLCGRNLPEITGDFVREGLDLSALYETLPVPLDLLDEAAFFAELESAMRAAYKAYGRAWKHEFLEEARAALVQDGKVDFGILSEPLQRQVIEAVHSEPALFEAALRVSNEPVETNRRVAETAYSPAAYGDRLLALYQGLLKTGTGAVDYIDGNRILDTFLEPKRFNLLRT